MTHELKILPEYFEAVYKGYKNFEIRKNDRNFKVGDTIILKEYLPEYDDFSGMKLKRKITYITDYAQKENYVVMALSKI